MDRRRFLASLAPLGASAALPLELGAPRFRARRLALSSPLVDAHAHVMTDRLAAMLRQRTKEDRFTPKDAAWLLTRLDQSGVKRALVLSTAYINAMEASSPNDSAGPPRPDPRAERQLVQEDNEFAAAEAAKAPGRLLPFASLNPKRDWAVEELDRCVTRLGMRGLKLHFWNSEVHLRDPQHVERLRAVFARAAEHNVPIVAHIFNGGVQGFGARDVEILVSRLIQPLPTLRISIAHLAGAGGFDAQVQQTFEALIQRVAGRADLEKRVFVDCSAVLMKEQSGPLPATTADQKEKLTRLLMAWGLRRVLWGSDNVDRALEQSHGAWPLNEEDWETMAQNDGAELLRGTLS